ncbi:velvet factor-domain-containing protein [Phaeosphaeria sp. MPI-PUGE-AT-0046c]|nr:velvet factor-domain-containing protein [Phaeosphaeria sp. MPI-PUGE-AT-0046c]
MSQPPPPAPPPLPPSISSRSASDMTETQKLPHFSQPGFHDYPHRRLPPPILPPLDIPPDAVPPRADYPFRSPINQLPSISSGLPPRHDHFQPSLHTAHRSAAPVEKLLLANPYTPPRSDPPYSPQQYGPSISPRSEFDSRGPRRLTDQRYLYEDSRHTQHHPHHEQPFSSLASPVEHAQQRSFGPVPSPGYTPSYSSSNTPFRGSIGSHPQSQRGSVAAPLPPVAYSEPSTNGPPPRNQSRPIPLPGSIPQPVYNEQLNLNYELRVRQQPIAARACGFGERDRRVIDPPPIIQLLVTNPKTGQAEQEELRYSLNVVHCTLWNAEGTNEETALIQPDRRTTRRLMGQLVASPSVAKDEHDVEGCFFCFPDLSCRTHGRYRLRFVLMRIDPMNLHVGGFSPILTEVLSDVFTVYTAKDFPGMRPSSALTRALKLQGCNIQVKKGNEKALARKRLGNSQEHEVEDDDMKRRRRD